MNSAFGATIAFVIVAMLVSHIFSTPLKNEIDDNNSNSYPLIWERYLEDFTTDDVHSYILQNGTLTGPDGANMWSGTHHFVEFDLPLDEGWAAPNGKVSLSVWIQMVPNGTTVTVIA